jgi:hypothetical protein
MTNATKTLPATFREILENAANSNDMRYMGIDVEFTNRIEDYESCADRKMRARIVGIMVANEDCIKINFSYKPWEDYNRQYEQHNYYDKQGEARLSAREANVYHSTEWVHFEIDDAPTTYFAVVDAKPETKYTVIYSEMHTNIMRTSQLETANLDETLSHIHHDIVMVFAGWPDRVR